MPIVHNSEGVPWLQPQGLDGEQAVIQLTSGATQESFKKAHNISDAEWDLFMDALRLFYKSRPAATDKDAARVKAINAQITQWAMALPVSMTVSDLNDIEALVNATPQDPLAIQKEVLSKVVVPSWRAGRLHGGIMQAPVFQEFAYLIDSAAFSYYRGNTAGCLFTLVPVVEGILLRWQGLPSASAPSKPSFNTSIQFLQDSPQRQPFPLLPQFYDATLGAVVDMLRLHLFKNSQAGPAHDHFNRHLMLHHLDDQPFCTRLNCQRAFLLIDLLNDLYVWEHRLPDPRFRIDDQKFRDHHQAYVMAVQPALQGPWPEGILHRTHSKLQH